MKITKAGEAETFAGATEWLTNPVWSETLATNRSRRDCAPHERP